jgi:multidrug efflux pump
VIAKVEADAFPVIWLAFSSDTLSGLQINDLVNRIVKPRLQTVTGVADVRIFGERKYAMRVWLDPDAWPPTNSPRRMWKTRSAQQPGGASRAH